MLGPVYIVIFYELYTYMDLIHIHGSLQIQKLNKCMETLQQESITPESPHVFIPQTLFIWKFCSPVLQLNISTQTSMRTRNTHTHTWFMLYTYIQISFKHISRLIVFIYMRLINANKTYIDDALITLKHIFKTLLYICSIVILYE